MHSTDYNIEFFLIVSLLFISVNIPHDECDMIRSDFFFYCFLIEDNIPSPLIRLLYSTILPVLIKFHHKIVTKTVWFPDLYQHNLGCVTPLMSAQPALLGGKT